MRKVNFFTLAVLVSLVLTNPTLAEEAHGAASGTLDLVPLGKGLGMGIAAFGVGGGIARVVDSLFQSISRNPGAAGLMTTLFYVGAAFIEALGILTFVICFMM